MAVNYSNIIDKGAVRAQDCPECTGCDATVADPIRAALVSGGVSSADLSAYDAAGPNTAIYLTSINTIVKVQSLRTATLSISGAYRIGNSDTNLEAATTSSTTSLSGPATPPEARLIANTAAVFAFVRPTASWSAATAVIQEPRKGTYTYESTVAGNTSKTLGVWTGPLVAEAPANTPIVAWVIKTPTIFESVDRNTAMWHQTSVGTGGSSNNQIGTSRTTFTTSNVTNRQWQMIAANVSAWPVTICSLDTSSGGTATQTVTGATVTTTFTVSGFASGSGLSTVTPTITRSNATISNVSPISVSGSTFTFSADVLVQAGEPAGSVSYTVTILGESVTVTGENVTDAKVGSLSTSIAAYNAAAENTWVSITQAEYNNLFSVISGTKVGVSDRIMNTVPNIGGYTGAANTLVHNSVNSENFNIPANSFIYAVQVKTTSLVGARFGFSTPLQPTTTPVNPNTFTQQGSPINNTVTGTVLQYFVFKGDGIQTTVASNFNFVCNTNADNLPWNSGNNMADGAWRSGVTTSAHAQTSSGNGNAASSFYIQGLSTTTKQW
jgi:hypothetical protein